MTRVFSGARPTGRQHLGNYLGAIQNYVKLQGDHQCLYCIVDLHALTTLEDTDKLRENTREMLLDWLAAGLDPEKSILFVQSHVPQVMELHTLLSMVTPLAWLTRVTTFKEKVRELVRRPEARPGGQEASDEALMLDERVNYGLLGYPVLMTADIILYKAEIVPVGEDQLPHLELAREIARRFNRIFGPTFPEPQAHLTPFPRILGLDGVQKMSKSLNNHIEIAASPEEVRERVMSAFTDPQRRYRTDPGRPEVCNIYSLHKVFSPDQVEEIGHLCRTAGIGCVEDKENLAEHIIQYFGPFRERRAAFAARPGYLEEALAYGAERARAIAKATLEEVRERIGLP